ncbi:MAG: TlpA family protein disulfide reductase [Pirellulales bacterium]|nr:TlpA family protein disulfide reductase [Pirellulales bacterium]
MNDRRHPCPVGALALLVLIGIWSPLGCGPKATVTNAPTATAAPSQRAVELTVVDRAGFDAAVERLRGKVVLVDFWATWCLPCVEQLPHTIALGNRLADKGLAIVTVSCDEPENAGQVKTFLESKQAGGAVNLLSQTGGSPQTMESFEIETGAVPFYRLYDRTGKLRQTFGIQPGAKKQFTSTDIEAAVTELLGE